MDSPVPATREEALTRIGWPDISVDFYRHYARPCRTHLLYPFIGLGPATVSVGVRGNGELINAQAGVARVLLDNEPKGEKGFRPTRDFVVREVLPLPKGVALAKEKHAGVVADDPGIPPGLQAGLFGGAK